MSKNLSETEVEEWLDSHPEQCLNYFIRKMELPAINSWLVSHGFPTINDYESGSQRNSGLSENVAPAVADVPPEETSSTPQIPPEETSSTSQISTVTQPLPNGAFHFINTWRRCHRHDFAKSKSKSVLETNEPPGHDSFISASRRNSLKEMRKYTSLPPNSANMLSLLIESKVKLPKGFPSNNVATKREMLRSQGEKEFFLNIVRDIATELDLISLTEKTVDNIMVLLDSDRGSLFLVEGNRGGCRTLVSKIFDVHSGASAHLLPDVKNCDAGNEVRLPWRVGIVGHVADSGETVNLQLACEDARFNTEVDKLMNYHTETLLCMPVRNANNEIIAVAQVVNKNKEVDGGFYVKRDENLFETYLQFVGIAITNARIVDASRQEYDRNRNLLEVVHDLFEEQTSLEKVILKIMQRAQRLLQCQRAAVLLLDDTTEKIKFSKLFELSNPSNSSSVTSSCHAVGPAESASMYMISLAEKVATTGDVLNVAESLEVEKDSGGDIKNLLAMPIRNSHNQIIGVATIINKLDRQPFDENDEQLFEAFSIFCGLGIHNTIMYSELEKSMARQKVALEMVSYHATASNKEVEILMNQPVPCADELNLYSLAFDDFSLDPDEMVKAAVAMFLQLGLVKRFSIEQDTLYRFLITVKRNYRDVPYHNWRHAFNVSQVMFAILMGCEMKSTFTDLEVLAMFVGCLCHDLDHRGTNNSFQQMVQSDFVLLYGTTNTMEHHHFNHAVLILSSENNNIFSNLSPDDYSKVMQVLRHSILATDLSVYFQHRSQFFSLVKTRSYSWELDEHRELLRSMLMTSSDIAASCKPWSVQQKVAHLVTTEFFVQGDRERNELHITPQPLMDRERKHELPQLQIGWISNVCLPLYEVLSEMNPKISGMVEGARENIKEWQKLVVVVTVDDDKKGSTTEDQKTEPTA